MSEPYSRETYISTLEESIAAILAAEELGFSWTLSARWEVENISSTPKGITSIDSAKEYILVIYEQDPPEGEWDDSSV